MNVEIIILKSMNSPCSSLRNPKEPTGSLEVWKGVTSFITWHLARDPGEREAPSSCK